MLSEFNKALQFVLAFSVRRMAFFHSEAYKPPFVAGVIHPTERTVR